MGTVHIQSVREFPGSLSFTGFNSMLMQTSRIICFPEGTTAIAHTPDTPDRLDSILSESGLSRSGVVFPRPVIVLVGGAAGLRHYHMAKLHQLFVKVLAPLAEELGAVVIDGGTDTGVMQMMGIARHKTKSTFPLVGVLPVGLAALPDAACLPPGAAPLEPHHTHFVLVPGSNWGDECPWLSTLAGKIAQGLPSVTVLVNGGEVTWQDAAESVRAARPIVAIAGSGRAADALAIALNGQAADIRTQEILASGLVQSIRLEDLAGLAETIRQFLCQPVKG